MLGKIEDRRRRGQQGMRWLDGINEHEFEQALGPATRDMAGLPAACVSSLYRRDDETVGEMHMGRT